MTKLLQWLVACALFGGVWAILLTSKIQVDALPFLPHVITFLPFYALVVFGVSRISSLKLIKRQSIMLSLPSPITGGFIVCHSLAGLHVQRLQGSGRRTAGADTAGQEGSNQQRFQIRLMKLNLTNLDITFLSKHSYAVECKE